MLAIFLSILIKNINMGVPFRGFGLVNQFMQKPNFANEEIREEYDALKDFSVELPLNRLNLAVVSAFRFYCNICIEKTVNRKKKSIIRLHLKWKNN